MIPHLAMVLAFQASTSIAILPIGDKSGERDPAFVAKTTEATRNYVAGKFKSPGWQVIDSDRTKAALEKDKFEANDREGWNTPNLIKIGKDIGADYIVFTVIYETFNGDSGNVLSLGGSATGAAKVKIWLIDTRTGKPVIKGQITEGKSNTSAFGDVTGSHARIAKAIQIALDKALDEPIKKLEHP